MSLTYASVQQAAWFPPHQPQMTPVGGLPVHFWWQIRWNASATSGYIVQEMYTELHVQNCFAAAPQPTMWTRYWEAWQITGANQFNPNAFDVWTIQLGAATRGWWRKSGVAYWVPQLDTAEQWSTTAVADSHGLLATCNPRQNLGHALRRRSMRGEWRACGPGVASNFHRSIGGHDQPQIPALVGA